MSKTEVVRARVSAKTKVAAEQILQKLGISMSEVINLLLIQIKLHKGLPFEIKIPNKETRQALEETDQGKGLIKSKDLDDLYEQLDI